MKLSDVARYWAAKELTRMERASDGVAFKAPFACGEFTIRWKGEVTQAPVSVAGAQRKELQEVSTARKLVSNSWCRDGGHIIACLALPKGASKLQTA